MKESTSTIRFPEQLSLREMNTLFREIPLADTTSRLLRKYFVGMANLYGILPLKRAYWLISKISPNLVTEEEFLAFAQIASHECEEYYILGTEDMTPRRRKTPLMEHEIIDSVLLAEGVEDYLILKQAQQHKPFYQPSKAELLAYTDAFYYEDSEENDAFRRFLFEMMAHDPAEELFEELKYATRCRNIGMNQVAKRMDDLGVKFQFKNQVERFAMLYQQMHNNTRMQCNRGFTPNELRLRQSAGSTEPRLFSASLKNSQRQGNPTSQPIKKIGRNEPCSCGSGKKYKHCCGKNG